jgi:hypothetical protein
MDKLFREAIIINVALLVIFILSDFLTWNAVALNLNSRMQTILAPNGSYAYNVTNIYSNYELVLVGINVRYIVQGIFLNPQESLGSSINLPLIWFILAMVVNLYLIWHFGIERLKELTETQKPSSPSAKQQKTN